MLYCFQHVPNPHYILNQSFFITPVQDVISNTRVKWETVETMNDFRLQL